MISQQDITKRLVKTGEKKYELSEYIPGQASTETIIWMLKKLKACFPETSKEALETLVEMLKDEQWSDIRIRDAVKEAIKTHKYPRITPANILDYDKRIRLYTMSQVQDEAFKRNGHHHGCFKGYKQIIINGWQMYYNEGEHLFKQGMKPEPLPEKYTQGYPNIDGLTTNAEAKRMREAFGFVP